MGVKLNLEDFNETQVRDLNQRHGSPVKEQQIAELMALLNGQPYLTRQALYTLVKKGWKWSELINVAATDQGPFADHLRHYYWLLHDKPALTDALKQIIQHNHCPDHDKITFYRLQSAGLVTGTRESCTCRCDLYRMYFEHKLR